VAQFDREAIQTRDYCVAKNATRRADRPDPFAAQKALAQDDNQTEPLPISDRGGYASRGKYGERIGDNGDFRGECTEKFAVGFDVDFGLG
jgi:hypothetical protein